MTWASGAPTDGSGRGVVTGCGKEGQSLWIWGLFRRRILIRVGYLPSLLTPRPDELDFLRAQDRTGLFEVQLADSSLRYEMWLVNYVGIRLTKSHSHVNSTQFTEKGYRAMDK
jgi:hypothetical protein